MEVPEDWRASKLDKEPRAADGSRRPPGRVRRAVGKAGRFAGLLLLAALAWTVWAVAAFYDFRSGLQDGDPVTLERRIDWGSVRQGLREDLQEAGSAPAAGRAESPGAGPSVDALLSRQAVINLLRTARLGDGGWDVARPAQTASPRERVFDWYRIRYAFFSGSPFAVRVDVAPSSDRIKQPLILLFRWSGDWQLTRVFLPADAAIKPAPQASSAATSESAPPPQPVPAGAQRAVLFEEDPADPQGKRYTGSAIWRTEEVAPAEGGRPELSIVAHVSIPERPLAMTMTIRRNPDKALPASHVIEVRFDLPANYAAGAVQDVLGVMMKPTDEATGQQLAGTRVKVSNDFFLVGLSAIDLEVQRNLQLLKDRAWIGIPFQYGNKVRALLAIEKGAAGENSITDALARWSEQPAAGSSASKP